MLPPYSHRRGTGAIDARPDTRGGMANVGKAKMGANAVQPLLRGRRSLGRLQVEAELSCDDAMETAGWGGICTPSGRPRTSWAAAAITINATMAPASRPSRGASPQGLVRSLSVRRRGARATPKARSSPGDLYRSPGAFLGNSLLRAELKEAARTGHITPTAIWAFGRVSSTARTTAARQMRCPILLFPE
jgi:hypothetical protein